jgi:NADPH-dependent 2,4-dienoyl-CoA reductase/sulfur reductase-like enzyme
MAAAVCGAQSGRRVGIVDENVAPGGQIWRGGWTKADSRQAGTWFRRFQESGVQVLSQTQVIDNPRDGVLLAETEGKACEFEFERLIVATGARELFLPFAGWTLPNVMGAGGLQALVKSGFPIEGKRVAVAGSGPLLLAVAALLRRRGALLQLVAEQATWGRLVRFGLRVGPKKLVQGMGYRSSFMTVRYATGCWPVEAQGGAKLERVTFCTMRKSWQVPCDYLACGFGFVPNLELSVLLGCELQDGFVRVDPWQKTSVENVYCAGEPTGIGGVDLALIEGQIAGYAAAGETENAARLLPAREKARRFARSLNRTFAIRDELKQVATPDTIVCRCEDVTRQQLDGYDSWRAAKLQTRCGMGPCQGRVCGAATQLLYGWKQDSVRPPILPATVESLTGTG